MAPNRAAQAAGTLEASLPEMAGTADAHYDGRYRLYSISHVPFDALPPRTEGGPATVAHASWSVSTSSDSPFWSDPSVVADDGAVTLKVFRFGGLTGWATERHPLDGTKYASDQAATRAAYEAGVVAFMVFERDRTRYGLAGGPGVTSGPS